LEKRIDAMLRRDIVVGIGFASLMWLTLVFTFVTTARVVDDATVTIVIAVACGLLGLFNTLSLLSLIRRYQAERHHVYGEDIHHLDLARAERSAPAKVGSA
jgi:hypothetical protein